MTLDAPLTATEVRQALRASKSKVLELIHGGSFPGAFRVGTDWRIPTSDVQAFIERNRVQPAHPPRKRGTR